MNEQTRYADWFEHRADLDAKDKALTKAYAERDAAIAERNEAIHDADSLHDQYERAERLVAVVAEVKAERDAARAEASRYRNAVAKFLNAKGHDLCHENRRELAKDCGLHPLSPAPVNISEFDDGCQAYQREIFGACGRDKLEAELTRLREKNDRLCAALAARDKVIKRLR